MAAGRVAEMRVWVWEPEGVDLMRDSIGSRSGCGCSSYILLGHFDKRVALARTIIQGITKIEGVFDENRSDEVSLNCYILRQLENGNDRGKLGCFIDRRWGFY